MLKKVYLVAMESIHPLLHLILKGCGEQVFENYQMLETPTADDDRWAGHSLLITQPLKAKDLLVRSVTRGCITAKIELAAAYRIIGDWKRSFIEIESAIDFVNSEFIENHQEANFNRAFMMHELAIHQKMQGDEIGSLQTLELVFAATFHYRELILLRSGICHLLARIHMESRHYNRAAYYLSASLEGNVLPAREARILLDRARCYMFQSDFLKAATDFMLVREKLEFVPQLAPSLEYFVGVLHRIQGKWLEAVAAYTLASQLARQAEDLDTAFFAELCLAACQATMLHPEQAQLHLARASGLKSLSERDLAFLEWRRGQVVALGQPELALVHLHRAKDGFRKLKMPRELLGVFLHFAQVYLQLQNHDLVLAALKVSAEIAFESEDCAAQLELRGLPLVQQFLVREAPSAWREALMPTVLNPEEPTGMMQVELKTLGGAYLKVNGEELNLEVLRTVEMLVYFLKNPHTRLEKFLAALFPDTEPRRAANYFHKARQILKAANSLIFIDFDAKKKTYSVQCNATLFWDAAIVQQHLSSQDDNRFTSAIAAYTGEFLPAATSEWAIQERENLAWNIIKVGLETLQRWYENDEHQKCLSLAHRLLEIEPFNTALYEYVINTTLSLEGELAAKRELLRASKIFVEEFGEVPRELGKLRSMLLN